MTATIEEETPEVELTEFEAIDVQKVSGVAQGANGFPHLMLKGIPAAEPEPDDAVKAIVNGKVDQKPDIKLGQQICQLIGQAMGNESQEVAAGHHGEAGDVEMLAQAHRLVHQWHQGEMAHPDGLKSVAEDDEAEKAKLTTAARNDLSDSDFAIPETRSYPIHDEAHARNALSRVAQNGTASEKARVRAAVHKKYPDIGDDDSDGKSSKSVVAEGETTVDDVTQGNDDLAKAVEAAVTKALESHKAEIATLRDELAKVKARPIPGGPVLSANARPQGERSPVSDEQIAKADRFERLALGASRPEMSAAYSELARQARQEATKTS